MVFYKLLKNLLFIIVSLSINLPKNYAQLEENLQPEVTISQGTLVGTTLTSHRLNRNVFAFYGIPYAQPPIGDLRFANPVKANGWNGTFNASTEMRMCPQNNQYSIEEDEDCLLLRVYTPQLPEGVDPSLLPVMVYIHGGAFLGESPPYSGPEYLLDEDIVLVTVNYRLGVLGFLSTGDEVASGNWALKDQVLALEWVRDNIRFFGGDPEQVTIFGESAGSCSVHLLTLSDLTIGLFHKYITQSGSALGTWAHRPRAAYSRRAFQFGAHLGCSNDTSSSLIQCLRTLDSNDIVTNGLSFVGSELISTVLWGPTDEPDIEGAFLTDTPKNLFAAGKIRDVPWMSGIVQDEGLLLTTTYYIDEDALNDFLEDIDTRLPIILDWAYQSDFGVTWCEAAKSYYLGGSQNWNTSEILRNLTMLVGDSHFYYPALSALQKHHALSAENPQYFYLFNYRGTWSFSYEQTGSLDDYGVRHADDLIYLFPKDKLFSDAGQPMTEKDYEIVNAMVQLWTSFAINGTPTASALGEGVTWESYSSEEKYLRIGNRYDTTLEVLTSFFPERMAFWSTLDALLDSETDETSAGTVISSPNLFLSFLMISCLKFLFPAVA